MIKTIIKIVKIVLFALFLGFTIDYLGSKGLIGVLIIALGFGIYRLWHIRDTILSIIRSVETMLFSKPLDKDLWDKGEFKNRPKVKFVWRKKKHGKDRSSN